MTEPHAIALYRGGRCLHRPADPRATALLVRDGRIAWLGADGGRAGRRRVVDLDGALVTPAFVDAHVHATDTGLALRGLDLSAAAVGGARCSTRWRRSRRRCRRTRWCSGTAGTSRPGPEQHAADARPSWTGPAAAGGSTCRRRRSTRRWCPRRCWRRAGRGRAAGYDASGWVRRDAHHVVRAVALGLGHAGAARGRRSGRRCGTRRRWASPRCTSAAGRARPSEDDFTGAAGAWPGERLPEVYGYWGELGGAAKARELGAVGAGGDLYADGALGSRTAHLRRPYLDDGRRLRARLSSPPSRSREHLVDCVAARGAGRLPRDRRRGDRAPCWTGSRCAAKHGRGGAAAGGAGTGSSTSRSWTRR